MILAMRQHQGERSEGGCIRFSSSWVRGLRAAVLFALIAVELTAPAAFARARPDAPPSPSAPASAASSARAGAPSSNPISASPSTGRSGPPACTLVAAGNLDGEGDDEVVCWNLGSLSFWQRSGERWREVYPARGPEDATPIG